MYIVIYQDNKIKNMAVSDIRAINDDGSIKSLREQFKEAYPKSEKLLI